MSHNHHIHTLELNVQGMHCGGCADSVRNLVAALPGVRTIEVDLAGGMVKVEFDAAHCTPAQIEARISEGGYEVSR